jgi:hypothetical protein
MSTRCATARTSSYTGISDRRRRAANDVRFQSRAARLEHDSANEGSSRQVVKNLFYFGFETRPPHSRYYKHVLMEPVP